MDISSNKIQTNAVKRKFILQNSAFVGTFLNFKNYCMYMCTIIFYTRCLVFPLSSNEH